MRAQRSGVPPASVRRPCSPRWDEPQSPPCSGVVGAGLRRGSGLRLPAFCQLRVRSVGSDTDVVHSVVPGRPAPRAPSAVTTVSLTRLPGLARTSPRPSCGCRLVLPNPVASHPVPHPAPLICSCFVCLFVLLVSVCVRVRSGGVCLPLSDWAAFQLRPSRDGSVLHRPGRVERPPWGREPPWQGSSAGGWGTPVGSGPQARLPVTCSFQSLRPSVSAPSAVDRRQCLHSPTYTV